MLLQHGIEMVFYSIRIQYDILAVTVICDTDTVKLLIEAPGFY